MAFVKGSSTNYRAARHAIHDSRCIYINIPEIRVDRVVDIPMFIPRNLNQDQEHINQGLKTEISHYEDRMILINPLV
jgi:hypothetical protein